VKDRNCLTLRTTGGYAERSYTEINCQRALSVMGIPRVRGSELRIAETRAVNRALRKAYGLEFVPSKSWEGCLNLETAAARPMSRKNRRRILMVRIMDSLGSAINSVS